MVYGFVVLTLVILGTVWLERADSVIVAFPAEVGKRVFEILMTETKEVYMKSMKQLLVYGMMLLAGPMVLASVISTPVHATPLRLDYSVADIGGGLFDYEFSLVLDNHDGTWSPGQGWGWIIFGDAPFSMSPLTGFVGDISDLPIGPYTHFASSGGGHNGPTLGSAGAIWSPTAVGDTLNWSGTSTADLAQGELLFSTLLRQNNAVLANFEVAMRSDPSPVPEPSTWLLMGTGLIGLLGYGWRGRNA